MTFCFYASELLSFFCASLLIIMVDLRLNSHQLSSLMPVNCCEVFCRDFADYSGGFKTKFQSTFCFGTNELLSGFLS